MCNEIQIEKYTVLFILKQTYCSFFFSETLTLINDTPNINILAT